MIADRITRTGDGSHESLRRIEDEHLNTTLPKTSEESSNGHNHHSHGHPGPWGWGDADITKEDAEVTETLYPYLDTSKDD